MEQDEALRQLIEEVGGDVEFLLEPHPFSLVVLKGHFMIEEHLNEIMSVAFFYPEYLSPRFRFGHKVDIARALAVHTHEWPIWRLISKYNDLRNATAHGTAYKTGDAIIDDMRTLLCSMLKPETSAKFATASSTSLVMGASISCSSFLANLESDLRRRRAILEGNWEHPELKLPPMPRCKHGNDDGS